jgi:hypothetical protein
LDENYQTYLNRVLRLTLPETYGSQVQHIQESPKFQRQSDGQWQATPFPGYTIVSAPGSEDAKNSALYSELALYQAEILKQLGSDVFIPIPPSSFHLTVADLIWDSAYRHAAESSGFEERLRDRVASSFRQCNSLDQPIRFQVVGLMVMTRAITVGLAPTDEESYHHVIQMRRALYQSHDLIEIGIEQQYYFTAHITLGYFGELKPDLDREKLAQIFENLNEQWLGSAKEFWLDTAELRKFENMTAYTREPDWATFKF